MPFALGVSPNPVGRAPELTGPLVFGFSADERALLLEADSRRVDVVDVATGKTVHRIGHKYQATGARLAQKGSIEIDTKFGCHRYALQTGELIEVQEDRRVRTAVKKGAPPALLERLGLPKGVASDLSDDGRYLLIGHPSGVLELWDAASSKKLRQVGDPEAFPEQAFEEQLQKLRDARRNSERGNLHDAGAGYKSFEVAELGSVSSRMESVLSGVAGEAFASANAKRGRSDVIRFPLDPFAEALRHLTLEPGWMLCGYTSWSGGADFVGEAGAFGQDTPDRVLEEWAASGEAAEQWQRPVLEVLRGDGSLDAYLEASFFIRAFGGFLRSGHFGSGSPPEFVTENRLRTWEEAEEDVTRVAEEAGHEVGSRVHALLLDYERSKRGGRAMQRLEKDPRFDDWGAWVRRAEDGNVLVRFVAISSYMFVTAVLKEDLYRGGSLGELETRETKLAEGGQGYVI